MRRAPPRKPGPSRVRHGGSAADACAVPAGGRPGFNGCAGSNTTDAAVDVADHLRDARVVLSSGSLAGSELPTAVVAANDLAALGAMLDSLPNVMTEVAAVAHELGRQPRTARAWLIKYQDRVLFGKDTYAPAEYGAYFRIFETADEYFDYYRDYHAFWKLYGIDLPDEVLKKVYHANALRITAGLPQTGWPR